MQVQILSVVPEHAGSREVELSGIIPLGVKIICPCGGIVDTLVLEASDESRAGAIPVLGTNLWGAGVQFSLTLNRAAVAVELTLDVVYPTKQCVRGLTDKAVAF